MAVQDECALCSMSSILQNHTTTTAQKIVENFHNHKSMQADRFSSSSSPYSIISGNPFWRMMDPVQEEEMINNQLTAAQAIKMIDDHQVVTVLYTDGSSKGGIEDGGSAVVITIGTASNPVVLEIMKKKGAPIPWMATSAMLWPMFEV